MPLDVCRALPSVVVAAIAVAAAAADIDHVESH